MIAQVFLLNFSTMFRSTGWRQGSRKLFEFSRIFFIWKWRFGVCLLPLLHNIFRVYEYYKTRLLFLWHNEFCCSQIFFWSKYSKLSTLKVIFLRTFHLLVIFKFLKSSWISPETVLFTILPFPGNNRVMRL